MDEITKEQLSQMLERAGLDPSGADLERLAPMVRELGQRLKLLRSAELGIEEIGGVFSPHWPAS